MASGGSELTIGEAARCTGVPASTLRYWEAAGLLAASERVGGKRRYEPQTLRQISLIVLMKRGGFTLAEIGIVLAGLSDRTPPPGIWRELAERKLPEVNRTLAQATAVKKILEQGLRCDCLSVDDCLHKIDAGHATVNRTAAVRRRGTRPARSAA
ncbi:MAG TPA: MerR family transcriptional regulator [Solirubrobacteraceae bacterium]|nr:MerR family transcriptional regulator [Solirubrobacteraceae bacterium]